MMVPACDLKKVSVRGVMTVSLCGLKKVSARGLKKVSAHGLKKVMGGACWGLRFESCG